MYVYICICIHIDTYTYNLLLWKIPTNLQARYDLFCIKSAIKPQPTNQPEERVVSVASSCCEWRTGVFGVSCAKSEHVETMFSFSVASYRSCKNLWKTCVEYHTFLCSRQCKQTASWLTDGQKQDVLDLRYRFHYHFIEHSCTHRCTHTDAPV